jgi:hypothetical protein
MPADARTGGAGVAKKTIARKTTTSRATKAKRARPGAKKVVAAQKGGLAKTAAAYASLSLAKGLRVAASTIGMVRGRKKS